ncbi:DUF302 domain-containing protein [Gordonia rhizosphera]|uniref:DUF302 domain-containing protein n=1 Tax=Gordonia rhizosphera NBRC 16068 TaxID=1108045 RepID=K6VPT0_9ACTN|nr:DUF302 domain-containing protein [Gordonia rhizosphera]GAB88895.1 hypothetical protein GORHZ_046_00450 [Gordonia rhizosphera NBRC 16068]
MQLGYTTTLQTTFDEAVTRTRDALAEQGFGVLTEIDVQATLKKKLDEDMERYLILGACNPTLAHGALGVDRQIGLLLPCNVVVRDDAENAGTVIVEAMNPDIMVAVTDAPGLPEVAAKASEKLQAAISALSATVPS